ncbi:MAG: AMP-binding protein [Alphaproteobacteria bacterium]|nr:AMP-binding protein [Alphaproteobacteria bacterium]
MLAPFRQWSPAITPKRPHPWERRYPKGLNWDTEFPARPLTALFDDAAAEFADNYCINFRGRRYRYREVADLVDRAAKGFQKLGVQKGIKVGLMLPNSPYAVVCFYAVLKAGGTVVNINPLYAEAGIARLVADSSACILVTLNVKPLYRKAAPLLETSRQLEKIVVCSMAGVLPFLEKALFSLLKRREVSDIPDDDRHLTFERLIDNDGEVNPVVIDPEGDVAVLQYTGGTTGSPKGARLTHANLSINAAQIALWGTELERGQEKILGVLPLFHAFGMTAVMNLSLTMGAEMLLQPHFKPAEVLKIIARERATMFIGVPTMYSALIAAHEKDDYDLSSLKFCVSGGAPLPVPIQQNFSEITGHALLEGYGLSETAPVCTVNPVKGVNKPGSVGLPLPGTIIEIVSLDSPNRVLAQGEQGEICITGPQVMLGYANRAQDNKDVFRGRRMRTGDVGYLDEDGYLFIVDRIKELILSGGYNVYPRMVEDAIYLHEAVAEVAVCGVPDPHRGETVKAFVHLRNGETLTAGKLRAFLKDKLAPFEMPRRVEFRDALPKTLIGKIAKRELVDSTAKNSEADA